MGQKHKNSHFRDRYWESEIYTQKYFYFLVLKDPKIKKIKHLVWAMVADLRKSPSKIVFAHFEPKLRKRPKLQNPINPEIFDCERKYFTEFLYTQRGSQHII